MSGGFSSELKHQVIEENDHRCKILGLQVDKLEGHHCLPRTYNGSNNRVNLLEVAGEGAYCAYGVPVEDVHERLDKLALKDHIFYDTRTERFVSLEELDPQCFRNGIPEIGHKEKKEKKHKKRK